jgi:hypothetical protein
LAKLTKGQREKIGRERIMRLLERHGVATMRVIEQKIADAGPNPQRVNPHILTAIRKQLAKEGKIGSIQHAGTRWYFANSTEAHVREARLAELGPLHAKASDQSYTKRVGDALEIATYRALLDVDAEFQGRFRDLGDHDDSVPYSKEEPPSHIGKRALPGDMKLDFHYRHPDAGWAGLECKNIREWLYPNRLELRDLIRKTVALDAVPVLIGRRIHPSTVFVFGKCGLIIHQTFNQRAPASEAALIEELKRKDKLGFFDIRAGNEPDARLLKFIGQSLPIAMPAARAKWNTHLDLLTRYAEDDDMSYQEFAGRVGRRARGENEDGYEPEPDPDPDDYADYY